MGELINLTKDGIEDIITEILNLYRKGEIQDLIIAAATFPDEEGTQIIYGDWMGHTLICDGLVKSISRSIDDFEQVEYED